MASPITQKITVDTKEGIKNVKDLTSALDDSESAGKQVAKALSQSADDIEADLKGTAKAADALAQALGPDMAAKLGQNGVTNVVGDLKKLGLTSDEIVTDVDELADSIKRLDAAGSSLNGPKQGFDDVATAADGTKGKLHDMNHEADNSRSVLANAVGNATQDIGALGGAAGTAGMAMGQLAEYATEGNISLSGLAKVAGPLAAVGLVTQIISTHMEEIARKNAFKTERVEAFTKALREGKTAIEAYDAALNDDGKIEFFDNATGKTKELTATLAASHITWDTFISKVNLGKDGFKDWVVANGEAIGAGDNLNAIIQAGTQYIDVRAASEKAWADQQEVSGQNLAETERETRKLNETVETGTNTFREAKTEVEKTTHVVDTFAESVAGVNQAYDELTGKLDEQDAWENVVTKIGEAGDAAKLTGQDARDLTRDIADYVTKTDTIPESKKTEILALLNEGDIVAAEQALADLTRTREIYLTLTGPGAVTAAGYDGGVKGTRASGGAISQGGRYQLHQDEIIDVPSGTYVHPAAESRDMASGAGGVTNVNIQVVLPHAVAYSQADLFRAGAQLEAMLSEYYRRRGF